MDNLRRDFRFAFRVLFKRPVMALVAVVALAMSTGMAITFFSVMNGLLLKQLPFPQPEQLQSLYLEFPQAASERASDTVGTQMFRTGFTPGQIDVLTRNAGPVFSSIAGYFPGTINVSGDGSPTRYDGAYIEPALLETLGVQPVLGGNLGVEPGTVDEILLSYRVWEDRFRGDPRIIGHTVRANGMPRRIVGILPPGFHFPENADAWMRIDSYVQSPDERVAVQVMAVGRINPDLSPGEREAATDQLSKLLKPASNGGSDGMQFGFAPFGQLTWNTVSLFFICFMIIAVSFVLLISCANVANLLIGHAVMRSREMAIRCALGANRWRIRFQMLTESFVLSLLGVGGGFLYALWAVEHSWDGHMWNLPFWISFDIDYRVMIFAFWLMVFTALVAGLLPAWQSSRAELAEVLKETHQSSGGFRLGRFTRMLTVGQVAFALGLLFAAGLTMRTVHQLNRVETGFPADQILTMRMGLFAEDYPTEEARDRFYQELVEAVATQPGVEAAAVSSWIARAGALRIPVIRDPVSGQTIYVPFESISPEYLNVMSIRVLRGRGFLASDSMQSTPVVLVNEAFARRYLPGSDPVGQRLHLVLDRVGHGTPEVNEHMIVGVVSNVKVNEFGEADGFSPIIYIPFTQIPSPFMSLMVRSHGTEPMSLLPMIQTEILKLDPHLPVYFTMTMRDFIRDEIMPFRMLAGMFTEIGLMAVFLAGVSVYGMIAFQVNQRRREIGIRMALGARSKDILRLILRQGVLQFVVGLMIGTLIAMLVGLVARVFLTGTPVFDWRVYVAVVLILGVVAVVAFYVPTRRAAKLSPFEALRHE